MGTLLKYAQAPFCSMYNNLPASVPFSRHMTLISVQTGVDALLFITNMYTCQFYQLF